MGEHNQRGVALLVVLLAVALLTVIVFEFTFRAQVDYRRAIAWVRVRQARVIADSGIAIAAEMLAQASLLYTLQHGGDEKKADGLTELWAQRCEAEGPQVCSTNATRGCAIDTFDASRLAVRIRDEASFYNLNRLFNAGTTERERFARLIGRLGLPSDVLSGVLEWTDRGSRGLTLTLPPEVVPRDKEVRYPVRAGPLASFGELGLVPHLRAADLLKLRRLATVLDPAVRLVNVNTASFEVLASLHEDFDDPTLLARLQQVRCERPLESAEALAAALGISSVSTLKDRFTYESEYFRVEATAEVDGFYQSVEALLYRPRPVDSETPNRGERPVRLVYYLPHRGPLIAPALMQTSISLEQLGDGREMPPGVM